MTNTTNTKSDVVVRRLYARGIWKLESVAHFGGDETGAADMCLLRDTEGKPFIPGASIAGAGRSFLARQNEDWGDYRDGKESQELKDFFGGAEKDDTMSVLIVADACCVSKRPKTPIRDGVRVDTRSGSAADKAKFDVEILDRGTEFQLSLECIVRDGDNQSDFEKLFLALLHGFEEGDIRLGARTRRGYGHGKVASWEIRDLWMDKKADTLAWLRDNVYNGSQGKSKLASCPLVDQRRYCQIEADFSLCTSLLIRSASAKPEDPDMTHLESAGEPVVPGTSFAGAFRHRAALIAEALCWRKIPGDRDAISEMFGPVHEQQNRVQQADLWASRVWIEEQLVKS